MTRMEFDPTPIRPTHWVEMPVLMEHLQLTNRGAVTKLIHRGLPAYRPGGRKLLFDLIEVDAWIRQQDSGAARRSRGFATDELLNAS